MSAHLPISLVTKGNRDLYSLVRDNFVGSSSIVLHRYHEAGLTPEHGEAGKLCHSVLGVDANTLNLYCMMQDMPMRDPVRTRWIEESWCEKAGRGVRDEASAHDSKVAHGWLEWVAGKKGQNIRHFKNEVEVRLGECAFPVDGFSASTSTVYPCTAAFGMDIRVS